MKEVKNQNAIIKPEDFVNDKDAEEIEVFEAVIVQSFGAFRGFEKLHDVRFGPDITRIGHGTFRDCKNLTGVWFALLDETKFVEIAEDAFEGCEQQITFHIFGSAVRNKFLNDYARRHGFRVEGMM